MQFVRRLPEAAEIREEYALTQRQRMEREKRIGEVRRILAGEDERKLLIIGPCSADREDAVLSYVDKLAGLAEKLKNSFLIIPRIYTSKPRTTGLGYKGMLHNPLGNGDEDILTGLLSARKLHIRVVKETGLYSADEMLYPEEIYYLADVLAYLAVGARSVEDQGHRMVASDNAVPVGMKNPTGGSKIALVNSIKAAQFSHSLIYRGWEVKTEGNPYAHAILRGFTNKNGKSYPNYHYEDLCELYDLCYKENLKNPGVIIDCNHANSGKKSDQQMRIAREVLGYCREDASMDRFIKGLMIESYLEDGCQLPGGGVFGKSITDPCLSWEKTEGLLVGLSGRD